MRCHVVPRETDLSVPRTYNHGERTASRTRHHGCCQNECRGYAPQDHQSTWSKPRRRPAFRQHRHSRRKHLVSRRCQRQCARHGRNGSRSGSSSREHFLSAADMTAPFCLHGRQCRRHRRECGSQTLRQTGNSRCRCHRLRQRVRMIQCPTETVVHVRIRAERGSKMPNRETSHPQRGYPHTRRTRPSARDATASRRASCGHHNPDGTSLCGRPASCHQSYRLE